VNEKQWKSLISTLLIILIISAVTSDEMFTAYKDTKNGAFAIICAAIWIGLFNSIQSVCRERAIIKREYRTGLKISAYIAAHAAFEFLLCAAETLIVLAVTLIKNHSHLPPSGLILPMAADLYMTIFLVMFSADMIALMISCIVKNENTAMTVMPFVLIIQLVMSGAVFELKGLSDAVSNFTLSKWGLNGICSVANTNSYLKIEYAFYGSGGCDPTAGNLLKIWLILIGFSLVYFLFAVFFLSRVDQDER
jgi:hypothetical protein